MGAREQFLPPPVGEEKLSIVVIGGGVTGVLITLFLTHAGHQVTLLEKDTLGSGSSQRSAGYIRQQFGTPSTVRGMVYATRFFKDWEKITGLTENPLRQNGYLFLYDWRADNNVIKRRVQMQQESGLKDVEFLSREEVEKRFQYIQTVGLTCATWCPSDGFLLPHIVYNDGASAAKKLGATIISGAEITETIYDQAKTRITGVASNKGDFSADMVINATNAWANGVSKRLGGTELPIFVTKRYLYFMAGLNGRNGEFMSADDFNNCPMVIGPNGAYCRPTPQQELMMGWLQHTMPVDPQTEDQDRIEIGFSSKDPCGYGAAVKFEVGRWLPEVGLGKIQELKHATCGFYAETPDHNYIIDFDPKLSNLIHAVGCSGHGLMHAPFTAHLISELVKAGRQINLTQLPLNLGEVDMAVYHANRNFGRHEPMQI